MRVEGNELQVSCMQGGQAKTCPYDFHTQCNFHNYSSEIHITKPNSGSIQEINLCACKQICTVASTPFIQVNIHICIKNMLCLRLLLQK
jgi:hypothetical protein